MGNIKVVLDHDGLGQLLRSQFAGEIAAMTSGVAAAAASLDPTMNVYSSTYTTDRSAGSVRVPALEQARDGVLNRAAAMNGLTVHAKG